MKYFNVDCSKLTPLSVVHIFCVNVNGNKESIVGQNGGGNGPRPKKDMSNVTCWNCGETGHIKRYCPQLKKNKNGFSLQEFRAVSVYMPK